jgi:N,N'-diacetyllegionaminate synthase
MATIIAELCQNHQGDRTLLKDMIQAAAASGANYVKTQTIRAEFLTHRPRFDEGKIENGITKVIKRPYISEYERLRLLDIDMDDHRWFIDQCHNAGVKAMTTVFTRGVIDELETMDWDAIKVASYDCASFPLLIDLKSRFKKFFVSTGATFDEEVEKAAKILQGTDITFLHCVTIYPTPLNLLDLSRLNYLKKFSKKVGFSDHTLVSRDGIKAAAAAIYFGAEVVERHFTVLKADETKDGPVSITPKLLKDLVEVSRMTSEDLSAYIKENVPEYDLMLGNSQRKLSDEELLNRDYYRGRFATKTKDGKTVYNWEDTF